MDKEQARFVLQSFRPDGADARDPDFAEALALAAGDRELGEWLARERAQDAAFAAALTDVAIPEDLRESIMQVLAGNAEEDFSQMDAAFVGALASVRAPEGLRDQIVTAMEIQSGRGESRSAPVRVRHWFRSASIAAALALGAFLAFQVTKDPGLTPSALEREAMNVLNASFTLDLKSPDHEELFKHLAKANLPIPDDLPDGLEDLPTVGCKILSLDGHKASLVCFKLKASGVVHLVIMELDEVSGQFGVLAEARKNCKQCPVTGWSRVSWTDDEHAFMLLGKMKPAQIAEAF
jgi:hypothetical protein